METLSFILQKHLELRYMINEYLRSCFLLSYIETVTWSQSDKYLNTFIDVEVGHFAVFNFCILTGIALFSASLVHSRYRRREKSRFLSSLMTLGQGSRLTCK